MVMLPHSMTLGSADCSQKENYYTCPAATCMRAERHRAATYALSTGLGRPWLCKALQHGTGTKHARAAWNSALADRHKCACISYPKRHMAAAATQGARHARVAPQSTLAGQPYAASRFGGPCNRI